MLFLFTNEEAKEGEIYKFIIRAEDKNYATDMANYCCGKEGRVWRLASCEELKSEGETDILAFEIKR